MLSRNVRAVFAANQGRHALPRELDLLAEFDSPGRQALLDIFRRVDHMACRMHTAGILARMQSEEAAEPIALSGTREAFRRARPGAGFRRPGSALPMRVFR